MADCQTPVSLELFLYMLDPILFGTLKHLHTLIFLFLKRALACRMTNITPQKQHLIEDAGDQNHIFSSGEVKGF